MQFSLKSLFWLMTAVALLVHTGTCSQLLLIIMLIIGYISLLVGFIYSKPRFVVFAFVLIAVVAIRVERLLDFLFDS